MSEKAVKRKNIFKKVFLIVHILLLIVGVVFPFEKNILGNIQAWQLLTIVVGYLILVICFRNKEITRYYFLIVNILVSFACFLFPSMYLAGCFIPVEYHPTMSSGIGMIFWGVLISAVMWSKMVGSFSINLY